MRGRGRLAVVCAVTLLAWSASVGVVGASDAQDPAVVAAQKKVDKARAAADEASQAYLAAVDELGRLDAEITDLETRIPAVQARIDELIALLRARAAVLYRGGNTPGLVVIDELSQSGDLVAGGRIVHLAEAAQADIDAQADELDAKRTQLETDKAALAEARASQQALTDLANMHAQKLSEALAEATASLQVTEQEVAMRRYLQAVAAQRAAAEEAARRANEAGTPPPPPPQEQTPPADPALAAEIPVANLLCPIDGVVSFWDDWGQARSGWRVHQGTDVFAAHLTPNIAIGNGIARKKVGGLGGNTVWLVTDDGNAYYYAHLDHFEGLWGPDGTRRVAQGEIIGYAGNTGNAAGGPVHTHFQIHPRNGGPINPYPLLREMCAVQAGLRPPPPPTTTVPPTTAPPVTVPGETTTTTSSTTSTTQPSR